MFKWIADFAKKLTGSAPQFKPCVIETTDLGLTEVTLADELTIWSPWTAGGAIKGHAIDLGYNQNGDLIGVKIWDNVARAGR